MKHSYRLLPLGLLSTAAVLAGTAAWAQTPTQPLSPTGTTSPLAAAGIVTGTGTPVSTSLTSLPGIGGAFSSPSPSATTARTPLPTDAIPSLTAPAPSIGPAISGSGLGLGGGTLPLSATTASLLAMSNPALAGQGVGIAGTASAQSGQTFTLQQVLDQAHTYEPNFLVQAAAVKSAHYDTQIAKAGLLPIAILHNQFLYTKAGRTYDPATGTLLAQNTPIFIANNAVHEYVNQVSVTETLSAVTLSAVSRAIALEAVAKAEFEIGRRGLTSTVVSLFYAASTTGSKVAVQQRAVDQAQDFNNITVNRETAREVAHADVVKANLTLQQRQRDLADAKLLAERARIDLGILLFADPRTPFNIDTAAIAPPPDRATIEAAAAAKNPEIASATASLKSRGFEVAAARAALLPDLILNYTYGIDNTALSNRTAQGAPTLGYSASATVDVPVFDWFAGINRVHQATLLRDTSKAVLSATQRTLIARLAEYSGEAELAYKQIESLKKTVADSQEALRLAKLRYQNGEALVLEVTDAQTTLVTAELALTDGITRYQLALANLQLLTGTI